MIHNFKELLVLIAFCENQIVNIRYELKIALHKHNFKKVVQLEAKEKLQLKKIQNYILCYKSKIKNSHLESKIYGSKLEVLEQQYNYSIKKYGSNIFCLEVLKQKHILLKQDVIF